MSKRATSSIETSSFSDLFVGTFGHDLRNPLSAITAAASLLEARAESEKISKPVGRIVSSAARMESMISQLLDFTSIRLGGGIKLFLRACNMADIVGGALEHGSVIVPHDVTFETTGNALGTWDGERLGQVLTSIISNARRHGLPNSAVDVRIDGSREDTVFVEVHNAGAIPSDVLPTLFDPLSESGERHRKREGSAALGLGLYVAQQIVLAHHGSLGVTSSAEEGTRFTIALPRTGGRASSCAVDSHRNGGHATMFSVALDQLSDALVTSESVAQLLGKIAAVFREASLSDVCVVHVADGNHWISCAGEGVNESAIESFLASLREHASVSSTSSKVPVRVLQSSNLVVHAIDLTSDEQAGELYFGSLRPREFTDAEVVALSSLSSLSAAAIVRCRAYENVSRAVRSRDDVLSVVAHDLQNPINVISIAANTLQQRLSDSSARRPLDRIVRGAQRADRLIQDLLEVNAIETGRFSLSKRTLEPAALVMAGLESQQNLAAEASVIIAADMSPGLPPVSADEGRILEVLENLIGNALKFTPSGGAITVGGSKEDDEVMIWVKDTGAGISPEEIPHIFDRFWQAKKTERRGTGLGLTICKGIVEAHGGRLWAESMEGRGTTVFFTLPVSTESTRKSRPPTAIANILLVDDRPENLVALRAILERPDYRLVCASSGEEALGLVLREQFSVALIDVAMPGMNGLEIAVHLKELERSRGIPIIFVTAFGDDPQEVHRAYSAGGADYLVKPLDAEIVRKKVAVFVELNRRREDHQHARVHSARTDD